MKKLLVLAIVAAMFAFVSVVGAEVSTTGKEPVPSQYILGAKVEGLKKSVDSISGKVENMDNKLFGKKGAIPVLTDNYKNAIEQSNKIAAEATKVAQDAVADKAKLVGVINNNTNSINSYNTRANALETKTTELGQKIDEESVKRLCLISGLSLLILATFILTLIVIRKSRNKGNLLLKNDLVPVMEGAVKKSIEPVATEVAALKKEVGEIKKVVKPDPFTLKFAVNGDTYEYNVPVNDRGKFISLYAPKVDPGDEPATPAETFRMPCSDVNDLRKSCKSAIKEYMKPAGDKIQRDLVEYLLNSTKELRKV